MVSCSPRNGCLRLLYHKEVIKLFVFKVKIRFYATIAVYSCDSYKSWTVCRSTSRLDISCLANGKWTALIHHFSYVTDKMLLSYTSGATWCLARGHCYMEEEELKIKTTNLCTTKDTAPYHQISILWTLTKCC